MLRNGIYQYRKVIPIHLRDIAGKREFLISLKTNNYNIALQKYGSCKDSVERMLASMDDGSYQKPERDFQHYANIATSQGRSLQCIRNITDNVSELNKLRSQLESLQQKGQLTPEVFKSYINIQDNSITLSELTNHYAETNKITLKDLNDREYRRKIDARKNSCTKLIKFLGKDKIIKNISKEDAREFYKHLKEMVFNREIKSNTAYKHIIHLKTMISEYYKEHDEDFKNVFDGFKFPKDVNKRSKISTEFIRDHWVNNPLLENMNSDLQHLLWAMIDTGCGAKELCGLDSETDIQLLDSIPHIIIRANDNHNLKTPYRERKIPLVGLALKAFQQHPKGFTRYCTPNGATNASAALNKFLKSNSLFESKEQTIYGVRHSFSDRLRNHKTPEEMRDRIMGHQTHGMRAYYGDGYTLEQIYKAMKLLEKDLAPQNSK